MSCLLQSHPDRLHTLCGIKSENKIFKQPLPIAILKNVHLLKAYKCKTLICTNHNRHNVKQEDGTGDPTSSVLCQHMLYINPECFSFSVKICTLKFLTPNRLYWFAERPADMLGRFNVFNTRMSTQGRQVWFVILSHCNMEFELVRPSIHPPISIFSFLYIRTYGNVGSSKQILTFNFIFFLYLLKN